MWKGSIRAVPDEGPSSQGGSNAERTGGSFHFPVPGPLPHGLLSETLQSGCQRQGTSEVKLVSGSFNTRRVDGLCQGYRIHLSADLVRYLEVDADWAHRGSYSRPLIMKTAGTTRCIHIADVFGQGEQPRCCVPHAVKGVFKSDGSPSSSTPTSLPDVLEITCNPRYCRVTDLSYRLRHGLSTGNRFDNYHSG